MKRRLLCLLLTLVMVLSLMPGTAADAGETTQSQQIPGSAHFFYNNIEYTLAMGHLEGSNAIHPFLGNCGAGFRNEGETWTVDMVVSVFQNVGTPSMVEYRDLTELITNVTFRVTGSCAQTGEVSQPNPDGTLEKDKFWTAPLTWVAGNGSGTLRADVTLSINGEIVTRTLELPYRVTLEQETKIYCADPATFPDTYSGTDAVDTMEELNALIQSLELHANDFSTTIVTLAPVVYYGVLDLRSNTHTDGYRNLQIRGEQTYNGDLHIGCVTAIVGGIRVSQHGRSISDLYLQKSENIDHNVYDRNGRACGILTDGGEFATVENCVFEDYDIGLANQNGYIAPRSGLRFRNCGIGVQITGSAFGNYNSIAENNKFVDCGIGMLIEDLPEYMSNYSFRVFNCDFLDNDTDITSGNGSSYYYCYGNFYGKTDDSGKIVFRNAKGSTARVLTNPRWKEPICVTSGPDQWDLGALGVGTAQIDLMGELTLLSETPNVITVEQSESETVLTDEMTLRNDLTYEYRITDPGFYTRSKPLKTHIVDNDGNALGTWSFDFPAEVDETTAANAPDFNGYLEITRQTDFMTVYVGEMGNACLPVLKPSLTVSCPANWLGASVSLNGTELTDVVFENEAVTFPVTAGGTYTITPTQTIPGAVTIDDVTVGFGSYMDPDEEVLIIHDGDKGTPYGSNYPIDDTDEGYVEYRQIMVRAGQDSGSKGFLKNAEGVSLTVEKMWIEILDGEKDTFSWSKTELVTEITGETITDRAQLYAKDGQAAHARLWATVQVKMEGQEPVACTVSAYAKFLPLVLGGDKYFESLAELETYLKNAALESGVPYNFYLKSGKHKGTLTLPKNMTGKQVYIKGMPNGSTTIEGSIDLNGSGITEISNISFVAPAGSDTKAICNGACGWVMNCSFYNYDVALDSSAAGLIRPASGNLFVNNTTAVCVDIANTTTMGILSPEGFDRNTFINNSTAIQVLSLHRAIGPFAYRVTNSNFINNGTDFDLDHAGSYFFYKNYFGKYTGDVKPGKSGTDAGTDLRTLNLDKLLQARSLNSLNRVLESRSAIIAKADGVTATTNPRWAFPVIKWWYKDVLDEAAVFGGNTLVSEPSLFAEEAVEEAYVNYLTSDWDGTEILNEEAGDLLLDARAFGGNAEKAIDVVTVDRNTGEKTVIGTWSFDAAQPALLSDQTAGGTFHAGVTVNIGETSATVTVEDSAVLQHLQPTFTVPAMRDRVQVVGPDNSVQEVHAVNNTLTARASCGGTYTILPYADLGIVENANGSIRVVVAEKYVDKQVLVASYDAFGKFLGLVPTIVKAGEAIQAAPMEGADLLTVFLVESMQDMTPKTAAITHDVT